MQITNNAATQYDLPGNYQVAASASGVTIADADYTNNASLKAELDSLISAGTFSVTTVPSGYALIGTTLVKTATSNQFSQTATATHAATTATQAAGGAGVRNYADHVDFGVSATPTAPVTATIKDGSTIVWQTEITAAGNTSVDLKALGIRSSANATLVANLPDLGVGVIGTVNLIGHTGV